MEEIDEIHVIADKKREPKKIVRDIETIVMVNEDKEINHRKISIAQVDREENKESRKVKIISIYQEHDSSVCHLKFDISGKRVEKKVNGSEDQPIPLIVSRGIVDIVENYIDFKGKLRIENIFTIYYRN